jgi:hypothetical protein
MPGRISGSCGTATSPSSVTAIINKAVATGRSMKGVEKLIGAQFPWLAMTRAAGAPPSTFTLTPCCRRY